MRRCALLLAFVFGLSSFVGFFTPRAYAAAALKVSTSRPFVGQQVVFSGDIGAGPARAVLQGSSRKGWVNSRSTVTKADGKFRFQVANNIRRSFRVVVSGQAVPSNVILLIPQSVAAAPVQATLSKPKKVYVNQTFQLTGDTGGSKARTALLQGVLKGKWVTTRRVTTTAAGKYTFSLKSAFPVRNFRVLVPPSGTDAPVRSPVVAVETKKNDVSLVLSRVGRSSKMVADGYLSADLPGRQIELQRVVNKKWVKAGAVTQSGKKVTFAVGSSTNYRLVARATKSGAPQVISNAAALSAAPSSLGDQVAYVQTQNGGTPTKKGKDYAATIKINGVLATLETIAVRGNTSATYPKRGYKIKFDDNISPLPGIPIGKTFNLLPDYQDRSLVRTAVSFAVANQLDGMPWNPNRAFVELFINGKYKGAYDLIESLKIDQFSKKTGSAARINVSPKTGVVIEIDPYGAKDKVPHWKSKKSKLPFKFKDPDEKKSGKDAAEGITAAKAAGMKKKVEKFESVLYGSNWKDPRDGWTRYMDMRSAVDWYLVKEFIKDWDGDMYRSNFFYTANYADPNAKLIMAPIWDVDRSAGAKTSGTSNVTSTAGWWMNGDGGGHLNNKDNVHTTHWFVRIAKDPAFQRALRDRWEVKRGVFKNAGDRYVDLAKAELGSNVAANDTKLWAKTGDLKRYKARTTSWSKETAFVKRWYQNRYTWMNSKLKKK